METLETVGDSDVMTICLSKEFNEEFQQKEVCISFNEAKLLRRSSTMIRDSNLHEWN